MTKKKKDRCNHKFGPIAPELGDPDDAQTWEWCIRCGVLRLGSQTFTPGRHQKTTLIADEE